jgi:uncharacterized protein YecE (DUF72 family)
LLASARLQKSSNVHIGCCGFALAQEKYFHTFSCVEIDSSFYQLPKIETARRWRTAAPENFVFTLKAWQVITHRATSPTYRRTRIAAGDREYCGHFGFNPTIRWAWDETYKIARALNAAVVLFQCSASFRQNQSNIAGLRTFFERAKRGKFVMAWEPRGDWDANVIRDLCQELELVHVVDPLKTEPAVAGKVRYYRLHGTTGPRHRYSDSELHRLKRVSAGRGTVFCMFNNMAMAQDARRFAQLVV